jgi:hypothetical protein
LVGWLVGIIIVGFGGDEDDDDDTFSIEPFLVREFNVGSISSEI